LRVTRTGLHTIERAGDAFVCKRSGVLFGWDFAAGRVLVTRGTCDSWSCAECAQRMRDRWSLRGQIGVRQFMREGIQVDFVTLTSHRKLMNFAQTEHVWRLAWPNVYSALKRRNPDLQYMLIPEKHKNGRMHVHAIWTAGVGTRDLKEICARRGLGYQLKVSPVKSALDAQRYIIKYLRKDLGDDVPQRFHRVRVSQGWPKIPAPNTPQSALKWEYTKNEQAFWIMCENAQVRNCVMIDAQTGGIFDAGDIDFSLIE